ncbi:tetratricopeptide repeat protein [Bacillus timonensis]|uniref:Tetratricopeptide repeat protein n=1 Tax=Bacillus timonensis TaxID=1033734 RepID=A0A4S3PSN2_9BACI|nr:tetratricopeptide repeat protein [Bacillus timonensis]THE12325.1 tetratricopeptide repeat protein [Bacillus timonensis]
MKQLTSKYNKAIQLLKEGRLEEAKGMLESILASAPFHSETNWTAGLVEIMMGNPVAGLSYWERVSAEQFPQIHERKEQILSTLGAYEEVRTVYNQALSFVKEGKVKEAKGVLSPLLQRDSPFPLPQDVYRLYFIILFESGKMDQAFDFFSSSPIWIQKSPSIKRFITAVKDGLLTEKTVKEREKSSELALQRRKKRKQKRLILSASALAVVVAGGIYISSQDWKSVPTNYEVSSSGEKQANTNSTEFEKKIAELESQLTNVESEKESLKKELELELAKVSEYETTEALYKKANVDLTSLRSEEARQEFNSGYSFYKKGDYERAKEKFELSHQLDSTQYFSDDSLYYYIQTEQKLGSLSGDSELFQQFFTNTSEHYLESPYQDDLLVVQANAYYREGKMDQALDILSKVQEQFPNEWTASYAKKLSTAIKER